MCIADIDYTSIIERSTIATVETGNFINKKTLSTEIVDLADIFD
jgi:hypothetical protein